MAYLEIAGGTPLCGEIKIQGSKNAVLPILAACMLGEGTCVIENCPVIGDVEDTLAIMRMLGCDTQRRGNQVTIDASQSAGFEIRGDQAARIRSSVLFLGALLGRMKRAVLPRPGGCAIGSRPVDLHLEMLGRLGAEFSLGEQIDARAKKLEGSRMRLPIPSVGATENLILAAVQAEGDTVLENAAREPEIDELCHFLNCRGAKTQRRENGSIQIQGGHPLGAVTYRMKADRIVTGTYLLAAAATGGEIKVCNGSPKEQEALFRVLKRMGAKVHCTDTGIVLQAGAVIQQVPHLETAPYPGFPTDLQSPLMAALCRADGSSCICEKIFENRFRTAGELQKMGAHIELSGDQALIHGVKELYPANLTAPDLRGGAALVLAALQTGGRTKICRAEYIERGYEDISRDLRLLGADIKRHK